MTHTGDSRAWAVRWLYAASLAHLVGGLVLPWIAGSRLLEGYLQGIAAAFWPGGAPAPAMAHQAWWLSVFGPTVQTVGILMLALVRIADRQRSASTWAWLAAGILVWAPQDIFISLQASAWTNIWLDVFAGVSLLLPLAWLWRQDRAWAQVGQNK